jgi:hypothetical protein
MDVMESVQGLGAKTVSAGDDLRPARGAYRCGTRGIQDTLLRKLVLRIEVQRRAELVESLDLAAFEKILIPALQMGAGEILPGHLGSGEVLRILWNQPGSLLKLGKGFIQLL